MISKRTRSGMAAGIVVTVAAVAFGVASAQTEVKPGFNLFSTEQDIEIGRKSATEVEQQLPILHDPQIEVYVNGIGARLAAVIPGAKFPYQFKIVNASDINAFALPGATCISTVDSSRPPRAKGSSPESSLTRCRTSR